jgi:hypothetical protein
MFNTISHYFNRLLGLDLRDKVDILHLVEREIKDKFMKDENVVIHKSHLPQGIGLVTNNYGTHLIATRRFGIGEPLFINRAELIPMDEVVDRKFCLEIDGKYALLDAEQHFIYRDGYAEMLGKTKNLCIRHFSLFLSIDHAPV